ncbi:response regulator [Salininema proteolyticum]|uniref:Response regulator n=1 Tax=Salininema proteolyticum TaxID=1607685 RepID=A0ABV8TYL3_9ACTN
MVKILAVDDEPQILRAMRINLAAHGYEVALADSGRAALRTAAAVPPDLVILDLGLPDMEGVEVIEGLRGWSKAPILVLSGRTESRQKIASLDAGADDYVTKPFDIGELLARVRALSRRTGSEPSERGESVVLGDCRVDLAAKEVVRGGEAVHLTPTEWALLGELLAHPGKLVPQRHLLRAVWGPGYGRETNYLRQYMAQLRKKLEADPAMPRYLLTEPGMGYRLRAD